MRTPLPAAMFSTSVIGPTISKCITHLLFYLYTPHAQEASLADLDEDGSLVAHVNLSLGARGALAVETPAALLDESARFGHRGRESDFDEQTWKFPTAGSDRALFDLVGDFLAPEDAVELFLGGVCRGLRVEVCDDAFG